MKLPRLRKWFLASLFFDITLPHSKLLTIRLFDDAGMVKSFFRNIFWFGNLFISTTRKHWCCLLFSYLFIHEHSKGLSMTHGKIIQIFFQWNTVELFKLFLICSAKNGHTIWGLPESFSKKKFIRLSKQISPKKLQNKQKMSLRKIWKWAYVYRRHKSHSFQNLVAWRHFPPHLPINMCVRVSYLRLMFSLQGKYIK